VAAGAGIAYYTACWPDIDTPRSLAARSLPPVTTVLSKVIRSAGGGHRGVTHHVLGVLVLAVLACLPGLWLPVPWWIPVAAVTGYLSHIGLDLLTTFLGIRSGKRKGRRGWARYGAEFWAVRPLAYLAGAGFAVIIVLEGVHP
jgi:hypothetical protein